MKKITIGILIGILGTVIYLSFETPKNITVLTLGNNNAPSDCVWVCSSEPPPTRMSNTNKPEWVTPYGDRISSLNNMWYPLEQRTNILRVGGWGDQYVAFLHIPISEDETDYKKVELALYVEVDSTETALSKMEIRNVTSGGAWSRDRNKATSWTPEWMRFTAQPSSEFYNYVRMPVKSGWVKIDITHWANEVSNHRQINHGLRFSHIDDPKLQKFVRIHGPNSEKKPQLWLWR